jgi:hypothetical protein
MKIFLFTLLVIAGALNAHVCVAQSPEADAVLLQGVLTTPLGVPLPDGEYIGTLRWYDAPQDGSALAEPTSLKLSQIKGAFTVELPASIFPTPIGVTPLYAEITIAQISLEPLKPRMRVGSVPISLHARSAPGMSPIGSVQLFAGTTATLPENWLPCDGRALKIASESQLYAVIGTLWGNDDADDDGKPDFNIPDLRGVFVRGSGVRTTDVARPLPVASENLGYDDAFVAPLPTVTMMYIIRVR